MILKPNFIAVKNLPTCVSAYRYATQTDAETYAQARTVNTKFNYFDLVVEEICIIPKNSIYGF